MKAVLVIGWLTLLGLIVLDVVKYVMDAHPVRAAVLLVSGVLLVIYRKDLTNWERGRDDRR